jgi:ParB-like nuclease domain
MYAQKHPSEITTLNAAADFELMDKLVRDMKKNGWRGRPLLVIKTEPEYVAWTGPEYVAWTGSHRIAAAMEVGLATVPCYLLPVRKLTKSGFKTGCGHVSNAERVEIVRRAGDCRALELMEQER